MGEDSDDDPASNITALLSSAVLAIAGCGGDDSTDPAPSAPKSDQGAAPKQAAKVDISDFKYGPDPIVVKAGGSVTWTNGDQAKHNAETDSGADGAFSTGDLGQGDSKKVAFDKAGSYAYYCSFHRFMKGTVEVK